VEARHLLIGMIGEGHDYIGCEHLLLGLLLDPESGTGHVLRDVGVDEAACPRAVATALAGFVAARERPISAENAKLDEIPRRLEDVERRLAAQWA
jgi:Clp amino terminal domain, pathogenicity island component